MSNTKSKAPAILGGCGCLSLLVSVALFIAAYSVGVTGLDSLGRRTTGDWVRYENTREGRTGNLATNYVEFSFEHPKNWTRKTEAGDVNFVTVERRVDERTWENLNVGYFQTAGSNEANAQLYAPLIGQLQNQFTQQFSDLRKVSEGPTKVGEYDAYEGLWTATVQADGAPVQIHTRAILLPTPDGKKGVTLLLMGTSFHPELKQPSDLGTKGELPDVLASFRFAAPQQ